MKHKKTLVAIILCIVLVFSAITFVACDDNGNQPENDNIDNNDDLSNNEDNASFDKMPDEWVAQVNQAIGKLIGYLSNTYSNVDYECQIRLEIYSKGIDGYSYIPENCIGQAYTCLDTLVNTHPIHIFIFENSETAQQSFQDLPTETLDHNTYANIYQNDIFIIEEYSTGLFESASFPSLSQESQMGYEYVQNEFSIALKNLKGNVGMTAFMVINNQTLNLYECEIMNLNYIGEYIAYATNKYKDELPIDSIYPVWSSNYFSETDSEILISNTNIKCHLKPKKGWLYVYSDNTCKLAGYNKNRNEILDVIIPSSFNGRPVIEIGDFIFANSKLQNITIPSSVTIFDAYIFLNCTELKNITFEGTKDQWAHISIHGIGWNENTGDFIIHCTDGDLDKNGNEI